MSGKTENGTSAPPRTPPSGVQTRREHVRCRSGWRLVAFVIAVFGLLLLVPLPVLSSGSYVALPCGYLPGFGTGAVTVQIPGASYVMVSWNAGSGHPVQFVFTGPGVAYEATGSSSGSFAFRTGGGDFSLFIRSQSCSLQPMVEIHSAIFSPTVIRLTNL